MLYGSDFQQCGFNNASCEWVSDWVSQWVSDEGTYWAVLGQLKISANTLWILIRAVHSSCSKSHVVLQILKYTFGLFVNSTFPYVKKMQAMLHKTFISTTLRTVGSKRILLHLNLHEYRKLPQSMTFYIITLFVIFDAAHHIMTSKDPWPCIFQPVMI